MRNLTKAVLGAGSAALLTLGMMGSAHALPALQLGPGTGDWFYDPGDQTWDTFGTNPFNFVAFANTSTGNGSYAWDAGGSGAQKAYLVVSAVPDLGNIGDLFDITVENDNGSLTLFASGYGAPPISDPNTLAPHSIFDTYFEIYEFNFDGTVGMITDTQPGATGGMSRPLLKM